LRPLLTAVIAGNLLLVACTIEPTPEEYFDHRDPATRVSDEAVEEIRDRIQAAAQALNRGDAAEAYDILAPAGDIVFVGAGGADTREGPDRVAALLERIAVPRRTTVRETQITAGPRAAIVWFSGTLDTPGEGPEVRSLYLTGTYLLREGEWRLVQLHVSGEADPLNPQPSYPAAEPAPAGDG
jgi:uncharacterized protein (TIGR02246 family)